MRISRSTTDHPRSRGVYDLLARRDRRVPGSSPLARGLRAGGPSPASGPGIIPARAGFTPRALRGRATTTGSSPLARGLPPRKPSHGGTKRIIPARAGFTRARACAWVRRGDHPRSRGVYDKYLLTIEGRCGSSPLARGLPEAAVGRQGRVGIIPARAGFTRASHHRDVRPRDHPRSRGVYFTRAVRRGSGRGSSPLARGLPAQ